MLARMSGSPSRSISIPIVLSSIAVLLTLGVLVGWIVVIRKYQVVTQAIWENAWLLVAGSISLALVMCVLVLFSISLVREILEGRRQQMFIDSVTHELKSPLASIKLCLETLERDGLSGRQQDDLKQMMLTDVERLSLFVDDILQASRIAHRLRSQTWVMVDVTELLTATIASIRPPLWPRRCRLHTDGTGPARDLHRSHGAGDHPEEPARQCGEIFIARAAD